MLGENHPATLCMMDVLAWSYYSHGQTKKAIEIQEKVLEARIRILGEEHPDTLGTMHNLASFTTHSVERRRLQRCQKGAGSETKDPERRAFLHADTMHNLASSCYSLGRIKEAAEMQVLEARLRIQAKKDIHS